MEPKDNTATCCSVQQQTRNSCFIFSKKCAIVRLSSEVAQRLWNRKLHYGSHAMPVSLTNQGIESWWSQFRKNRSTWWINYFKDPCERNIFNPDNELESECLWLCFSDVIQKDLDYVKEQWNTHRIRDSKHKTIPGIPDELYYFPEKSGGEENLAMPVANDQIQYVEENLLQFHEEQNLVQEYFEHIFENSGLVQPVNWQEAEQLHFTLMAIANGT